MKKKYNVKYYGHSAYSVETENYFLIFDYVGESSENINGIELSIKQSMINFNEISKQILMFNSHNHFDHYNPKLNKELSNNENIFTIVGGYADKIKNTMYILPGDSINIKGVQIYAEHSTDIGVCFVLEVDGLIIYFAGDNIDWGDSKETTTKYLMSMYGINTILNNRPIDICFVPVCNYSGQSYDSISDSAMYLCREFGAKDIYPMHAKDNDIPYHLFRDFCCDYNFNINILPKEK